MYGEIDELVLKRRSSSALAMAYHVPLWRHQKEAFSVLLFICAAKPFVTVRFSHKGTIRRTFDVSLLIVCKQTYQKTLDWPVIRDAMTAIWRRRNSIRNTVVSLSHQTVNNLFNSLRLGGVYMGQWTV